MSDIEVFLSSDNSAAKNSGPEYQALISHHGGRVCRWITSTPWHLILVRRRRIIPDLVLRVLGSASPLPARRLHRLTGRRGGPEDQVFDIKIIQI